MGARIDAATFNNPAVRVRRSNQKSGAITTIAMYWRERTKMDIITALAVSIGLLGTVATYLFLTIGTIQIWIGFVGWASFYHCGGGLTGLRKSVAANLWGVIMAYIALLLITQVNIGLPGVLWPSILVGVTAAILVLGAKVEALNIIPATVYGYASTAGYGLLSGASLTTITAANPLICVAASLVIGGLFGIVSEKFAGMLRGSDRTASEH
jgi:hypothetical protein